MKRDRQRSKFECEYLVGDDSCRAIKESDMGELRVEACKNEVKDLCCYLCSLRTNCEIGCDLPKLGRTRKKLRDMQRPKRSITFEANTKVECGICVYYMKPKCPRSYSRDAELWRTQSPCEIFRPVKKSAQ